MATAGRILILPKGEWASGTTYEMLDLVYHNGTSWIAKKTSVGIEPSDATNEYWHLLLNPYEKMTAGVVLNGTISKDTTDVYVAKSGNVLRVKLDPIVTLAANEWTTIATINNTSFFPKNRLRKIIVASAINGANIPVMLEIGVDGVVKLLSLSEMVEYRVQIDETFIA